MPSLQKLSFTGLIRLLEVICIDARGSRDSRLSQDGNHAFFSKQANYAQAGNTSHSIITMHFAMFVCLLPHDVLPDTNYFSHLLLLYNVMSHFHMNEGKMLFLERIKSKSY